MIKIILDTNFILTALKYKIDLFGDIEKLVDNYSLNVLDKTLDELEGKPLGKLALAIIKSKKLNIIETKHGYVDDLLVELANEDMIIGTQDKELKSRLKEKKVRILILRSKKQVKFE